MTHALVDLHFYFTEHCFPRLTVIPILGIADRTVGRRAGLWPSWTWILFPGFSK